MKIKNNCRKATMLIEKELSDEIPFLQTIELKIHLARCPECRLYKKQSRYIEQLVTGLLSSSSITNAEVDEVFKNKLEQIIIRKIENIDT